MPDWLEALKHPRRRGAYLITWGAVYTLLGIFTILTGDDGVVWGSLFISSGAASFFGGLLRIPTLDRAAFTLLTGVAAFRGIWYLGDHERIGWPLAIAAMLLWMGVAVAQVVVAGWPESPTPEDMIPSRKKDDAG